MFEQQVKLIKYKYSSYSLVKDFITVVEFVLLEFAYRKVAQGQNT
jgi:hypothetical protein